MEENNVYKILENALTDGLKLMEAFKVDNTKITNRLAAKLKRVLLPLHPQIKDIEYRKNTTEAFLTFVARYPNEANIDAEARASIFVRLKKDSNDKYTLIDMEETKKATQIEIYYKLRLM